MNESFIQQDELLAVLEAILFASTQPVTIDRIQQVLQIPESQIEQALQQLQQRYNQKSHGIELICKTDGYRLITKIEHGQVVADFLRTRKTGLSNAAMEVLAIAAYNQPVTKTYISQIRGVNSSEIVEALTEKGLLAENGKTDLPGRPMSYITTDRFLTVFNLDSLEDLPEADFLTDEIADAVRSVHDEEESTEQESPENPEISRAE